MTRFPSSSPRRLGLLAAGRGQPHPAVVPVMEAGRRSRARIGLALLLDDVGLGLSVSDQDEVDGHRHTSRSGSETAPRGRKPSAVGETATS